MRGIWRNNGLSIVVFAMFLVFLVAQSLTGHRVYNQDQVEHGQPEIGYVDYVQTRSFMEVTFENWESEFLQMAAYVLLTAFLFQRGSTESRDPDDPAPRDEMTGRIDPSAPWPVRTGGLVLVLYENSLFLAFVLLFLASFVLHGIGGAGQYNEDQIAHGGQTVSTLGYFATSQFWYESFQNWQSEFLAVGAIVVLSIFLRQKGSPESKPVGAPHATTGS